MNASATAIAFGALHRLFSMRAPRLVRDIRPDSSSSAPGGFAAPGQFVFLASNHGVVGYELWKTDGSTVATVADILPGFASSNPAGLSPVGEKLYCVADDGGSRNGNRELWRTAGGEAGLVIDLGDDLFSGPGALTAMGGSLFFVAVPGGELWVKTEAGSAKILDFRTTRSVPAPRSVVAFGGTLFFTVDAFDHGRGRWRDNGSFPFSVSDIEPGKTGSDTANLTATGGTLFFRANEGSRGSGLWTSDGVTVSLVADLIPGAFGSKPDSLMAPGGSLPFAASDRTHGRERWALNLDAEALPSTYSIQRLASGAAEEGATLRFRIQRTGDTASAGSVDVSAFSGSATSGSDFKPLNRRLSFRAGQTSRDVDVETLRDYAVESSERFRLSLRTVNAADRLAVASATGVILDRPLAYVGLDPTGAPFQVRDTPFDPTWAVRFSLNRDTLNPTLPTYLYVHGWRDNATSENSQLLFDALNTAAANVLLVDWSGMAAIESIFQPTQAVTATQQVGETIADFLINTGLPLASVTLIGHSLGSLVASSAAREIQTRTGQRISELVALDTAFGFDYDIDARTARIEAPLTLNTGLATTTTSFTVSDLIGGIPTVAGDNERAATADHAYLVQYARSRDLPRISPDLVFTNPVEHAAGLHNGVIGVYADLFRKQALNPAAIPIGQRFDTSGKPNDNGGFDGVVVAPLPWSYPAGQIPLRRAPRAIGWANRYDDPVIYGSNADDVMFFDLFRDERDGAGLHGRGGNDWLIADQTDSQGIDFLTGGRGSDQFWFGYERYGQKSLPYINTLADPSGYGGNAYAVITDFNRNTDALRFGWKSTQIKARDGSAISGELVRLHGDGTAFMRRGDLIAYVPGLNVTTVPGLEAGGRLGFGQFAPLEEMLFF